MAAKGISCVKVQRNSKGFTAVLSSTLCEWLLIFLLFIDAVLSYLLTKFSRYCKLQTPCPLCSRLDHVLGNEEPEFYHNLLCGNHRSEVSSLISCQIHDKLADVHGMCEECLFSSTIKKSNSETHRLLVGKLGLDLECLGFQRPFLKKESVLDSPDTKTCSCCNKPWRPGQISQRLLQLRPTGAGFTKPDIPLHRLPGRSHLNHRDNLKKIRDKVSGSVTSSSPRNGASDHLSHVGYSELKFTSDSESEVPLSDDDNVGSLVHEKSGRKQNLTATCAPERSCKPLSDDVALGKQIHQASNPGPSLLDSYVQTHVFETHDMKCLDSEVATENRFGELNWQQANQKFNPSALPELISLVDILPSPNIMEVPAGAGVSIEKSNVTGTSDIEHGEVVNSMSARIEEGFKTDQVLNVPAPSMLDYELQIAYACGSNGIQKLQKSASLRRDESGMESLSGSTFGELEGENDYDPLKQQVEYDQRCVRDLMRELEEERSASAVAANQTMAMITRLQEEKAALHMEALQYLRMMEEQAEYDVEALEKANDLLAEREKDIQDLEAELEFYRKEFEDRSVMANMHEETCDLKRGNEPAILKIPWLEFEDEKQYISECLKKLEMKLQQCDSDGASEDKFKGQDSEKSLHEINKEEELNNKDTRINHKMEENGWSKLKDLPISNGSLSAQKGSNASVADSHFACEENNDFDSNGKECSTHHNDVELFALRNEVSDLNDRLKTLEADYHFLEHTFNSMRNGSEGLEFVQEVARQLREIQKIRIRKGCQSVP
ncbi:probable myosin-binding protein 4 isoform X2 [Vitis riparia]|uniref:probable myosin-binding protein 4 isoform X2 n=1 Tax=Vitis riparia TaxID=96939 RepID=UPI00155A3E29|nr:probable myosin-binding protein 4 isoform X2 [Vitis riparia]